MLKKMFKMKGNKGFTLVELMVVVAIIGVLTAIAVPVYNSATEKAKINAIAANLRIINGAISQYMADNDTSTAPEKNDLSDYIQSWPDKNPKGVTYVLEGTGTGCHAKAIWTGNIYGLAGVEEGRTLQEVQDQINADS
mgnify:CR=1 FL=1